MPADYLPARDADLALWTANFTTLTTATPVLYGITAPQALNFSVNNAVWQASLSVANDPATRTKPTVAAKDAARAVIRAIARQLAGIVQNTPGVTAQMIADLGLTIRSTARTPTPPPATSPILTVAGYFTGGLNFSVTDITSPLLKRRPPGVIGCELWYVQSAVPPIGLSGMDYQGLVTRTPTAISFPVGVAGKQVYLVGRWINRRGEVGPLSAVVGSVVPA